jgi:hypothetical protein
MVASIGPQLNLMERLRAWLGTTVVDGSVEMEHPEDITISGRTLNLRGPESVLYLTLANGARIAIRGPEGVSFNVYESPRWPTSKYAQGPREAARHLNKEEVSVHRTGRT